MQQETPETAGWASLAFQMSGAGTWSWNPATDQAGWDETAGRLLGKAAGEKGGDLGALLAPFEADADALREQFHRAAREHGQIRLRLAVKAPGVTRLLELRGGAGPAGPAGEILLAGLCFEAEQQDSELPGPPRDDADVPDATLIAAQFEASLDGILITGLDRRWLRWNRRFQEMWDVPEEVLQRGSPEATLQWAETVIIDPQGILERSQHLHSHPEESATDEVALRDGRVFDRQSSPLRDASGRVIGRIWTFRDITPRRNAEAAASQWRNRYETAIAASGQVLYDWDSETGEILWAGDCAGVLGYQAEELAGGIRRWCEVVHPDDLPGLLATLEEVAATRTPFELEYRICRKDGQPILLHDRGAFLPGPEGASPRAVGFVTDVTARREMEQEVQAKEQRFRTLIENSQDIFAILSEQGEIRYASRSVTNVLGLDADDLVDHNVFEYVHPEDVDAGRRRFEERARQKGAQQAVPVRFRHRNGSWRLLEIVINNQLDNPLVQGLVVTARDITESRQLLDRLQRMSKVYMNAIDPITIMSLDGTLLDMNTEAERTFGWNRNEIIGQSVKRLVPDAQHADLDDLLARCRRGERVRNVETVRRRRTGEEFPVLITWSLLYDEGRPSAIASMVKDLSELRQARESLRERDLAVRALLESAAQAVLAVKRDGGIVLANRMAEVLFGYTRDELLNMRIEQLIPHRMRGLHERDRARFFDRPGHRLMGVGRELVGLRKDGAEFPAEASLSYIRMAGEIVAVSFVTDTTERRQAEDEKARLEEQLRRSQKLEAVGVLAGGIAHDFNNILTSIIGFAALAEESLDPGTPEHDYVREVLRGGERARELVKQILTFSRQAQRHQELVDVAAAVRDTMRLLRASIPSSVEIEIDLHPDSGVVLADPTHIHQIVMNLCTNAYQAMRLTGGRLQVRVEPLDVTPDAVALIQGLTPGPHVRLTVQDTGSGVDPAVRDRIFDPFFTTKAPGEGTGLGLSVVHGIVIGYTGAITLESEPGLGATFSVYLPRQTPDCDTGPVAPRKTVLEPVVHSSAGEHVLLVDDEEAILKLGQEILERLGYRVTASNSGREARDLFQARAQAFDAVVTDLTMPGVTGIDLARAVQRIRPEVPVILVTGYREAATHGTLEEANVREVVLKPFGLPDLAAALKRHLEPNQAEK